MDHKWSLLQLAVLFVLHGNTAEFIANAQVTVSEYDQMPLLFHLDDFHLCMNLEENAFYCKITVQLTPEDENNTSQVWNIIKKVSDNPRNYRHDLLRHGICVPKSCPEISLTSNNEEELKNAVSSCYYSKYKEFGLKTTTTEIQCETNSPPYEVDEYDMAFLMVVAVIVGAVIWGSFYEGYARYKNKEEYEKIVGTNVGRIAACFSLPKNWSRLRSNVQEENAYKFLNGIRFYNTQLVIMTHVGMICFAGYISNPSFLESLTLKPENMIYINGACAIQTFFLISGYLIAYNFLLLFEKRKEFELRYLVLAFINRYVRLTPCLLLMIGFNATWLYRIARGPVWDKFIGNEFRNCRKNWWVNLLYINNFYDSTNMCMQHTWYLATDTQLFLVALIVISFMWKYQHRIKLILGISLLIGIIVPGALNYYNDYDIVIRQYPEVFYNLFLKVPQWHAMYSSSLTNFGGYAQGMLCGYLVYINQKNKTRIFTNKVCVALWWIIVWGLPLSVIYYGVFIYQDDYQYTRIWAAVYAALQRNLFALGIASLMYGLTEGIGWFLRDAIFWSPVQILGKLTYCTFLAHVAVIRIRGGQVTSPIYVSNNLVFTQILGDGVLSYIFAVFLALFVEFPVSALQKLIVPQVSNVKNDEIKKQIEKDDSVKSATPDKKGKDLKN